MTLERRIKNICKYLPLGWEIRIDLERGAGNVTAIRPNRTEVNMGDGEMDIEEQVAAALVLALDEEMEAAMSRAELRNAANPNLQV